MQIPIELAFRGLVPSQILERHLMDRLRGLATPARGVWQCAVRIERRGTELRTRLELDADSGPIVLDASGELELDRAGGLREGAVRELVEHVLRDARHLLRGRRLGAGEPELGARRSGPDPALLAGEGDEPACIWYG